MKRFIFYISLLSSCSYTALSYALPDVVVTNVSYANGIFTSTVKNQGNTSTPSGTIINAGYFVDGSFKTWGYVPGPLAAGASVSISTSGKSYTIPTGTHTIMARTDYDYRISESNESNNDFDSTVGGSTDGGNPPTSTSVGQTGINIGATSASSTRLDQIKEMGAKWVRFQMGWSWIAPDNATTFNWTEVDSRVKALSDRGIQSLPVLSSTPKWARSSGCTSDQWCAPATANINDFANFAAAAAKRYPQISVWEIWNEPNHGPFWGPSADPVKYTALLKAAYKAIKAVNPNAIVITGGMAPAKTNGTSIAPIEFLQKIYSNGGGGSFDGVGAHPYCFDAKDTCPQVFYDWSAWSQMNDTNPSLRSVMSDNGDSDLKIWVTEFGAPTGSSRALTETQQANMIANAYDLFRTYSWAGQAFIVHHDKDKCTTTTNFECYMGMRKYDGTKKLSYDAFVEAGK